MKSFEKKLSRHGIAGYSKKDAQMIVESLFRNQGQEGEEIDYDYLVTLIRKAVTEENTAISRSYQQGDISMELINCVMECFMENGLFSPEPAKEKLYWVCQKNSKDMYRNPLIYHSPRLWELGMYFADGKEAEKFRKALEEGNLLAIKKPLKVIRLEIEDGQVRAASAA